VDWRCKETRTDKIIVWCKRGRTVCENHLRDSSHIFLAFTYKLHKKQGGMCYTIKCDTVENGLTNVHQSVIRAGKEVKPDVIV
jgi:hypothetical protein